MATDTSPASRSALVTAARVVLLVLAGLFAVGAFGQFFLVGLSMFDDASRWRDHERLGHMIGLLTWVMWIPALAGRTGRGLIVACVVLFLSFEAQYGFIEASNSRLNALHPLNGAFLLVLGSWIALRALAAVRGGGREAAGMAKEMST